ncbi:MAG: efflux transporter, family, subunit [Rhodospirillales bacterium]|jgi:multidrug efflux system membrane fusion protein|nr:efflux transporter, family, subunit [Rhodospirillales bacterium]
MRSHSAALAIAALTAASLLAGCGGDAKSAAAPPPPPKVEVTPVAFKELRQWADITGHLEAIDSVGIRPRVGGFIDAVRFQEGARVRRGDVLFEIDARPFQAEVDRLTAEVERSRARSVLAIADGERGQRLIKENAIARNEFERLQSDAAAAKADLAASQAALRTAQLNLEFTRVISPIDGRVSKALITRGNLVTTADLLTTVVSAGAVYASFNTDEQTYLKYAAAERGSAAPVELGLINEDGFPHRGKLQFLDNSLDARSGTINARAVFDDENGKLTPGLFARIRLLSATPEMVALTPERALGTDLGRRYVLVVDGQSTVEYRPVTLGAAVGELRIVTSGLKPGDVVVVSGLQKVKSGDKVVAVAAPFPKIASALQP